MPKIEIEYGDDPLSPPDLPFIEHMYAVLATEDGSEGLPAVQIGQVFMPLVAADEQRLGQLIQVAEHMAKNDPGMRFEVVKFSTRETLKVIQHNEDVPSE